MDGIKPKHDISIVIPVLDDAPALESLLSTIGGFDSSPHEVIVVSGSSAPALAARCAEHGQRYLETEPNRGAQLDLGARQASASVLWFVHASAELGPHALDAVQSAVSNGAESGCLRFAFQGPPTRLKRLISSLVAVRIRAGGIAYGDQALFMTRTAYLESGGFTHEPLFEEVGLIRNLRKRGSFVPQAEPVRVSTRRWERDGWIRRSLHNRWLAVCHGAGVSAKRLNSVYRRRPRTQRETGT